MTSVQLAGPGRSQATAIEQSRAAAEVMAAVLVAHDTPRNTARAIAAVTDACKHSALADRAFFRYNRGDGTVTGATVQLARELARCWGNIQYGVAELGRDDQAGESEMLAYAWDVETNARSSHIFLVPHARDTKQGRKQLTDLRDVYENNANNAARRLREAIFAVLPVWLVEQAKDQCTQTVRNGGGVPLPQRVAKAIGMFEGIGVGTAQLETKVSRKSGDWTEYDVAQLGVIFKSIERGEVTRDEEFPPHEIAVTADELAQPNPPAPANSRNRGRRKPADPQPPGEPAQPDAVPGPTDSSVDRSDEVRELHEAEQAGDQP